MCKNTMNINVKALIYGLSVPTYILFMRMCLDNIALGWVFINWLWLSDYSLK